MMCGKCTKFSGWLLLVFGILFLIADVTAWDFWGIQWWTVAFVLMGFFHLGMSGCADCKPKTVTKKK